MEVDMPGLYYATTVHQWTAPATPGDRIVNTWWFAGSDDAGNVSAETDEIFDALVEFWTANAPPADTTAVCSLLSEDVSRGELDSAVRIYDGDDYFAGTGPLLEPIAGGLFTLSGTGAATPLPDQIAICLSYASSAWLAGNVESETDPGDVNPPTRRPKANGRGRKYIGPLITATLTEDSTTHNAEVSTLARETIANAGKRLAMRPDLAGDAVAQWVIASRTIQVANSVDITWCDNRFDVMTSRAKKQTMKTYGTVV